MLFGAGKATKIVGASFEGVTRFFGFLEGWSVNDCKLVLTKLGLAENTNQAL